MVAPQFAAELKQAIAQLLGRQPAAILA